MEIKIPAVGESITEVTIAQWFKREGHFVEMDEVICEWNLISPFELNAEAAGVLHLKAEEGDTLEIGQLIYTIDTDTAGASAPAEATPAKVVATTPDEGPKATGEVHEMIVPTVGESITEVTISAWLKEDGDYVELDEVIAEVDSDEATFELPAEANGILGAAEEDDTIEGGALICKIEVMEGGAPAGASAAPASPTTSGNETYATGHASPAAAKILAEKGINPASVKRPNC